jgi:hypothetical protein
MNQEDWVKISELLRGDTGEVKLGMSMINGFPMTGNRAQVVTLAIIYDGVTKYNQADIKSLWGSYCKNWYWFLYNINSGLLGRYAVHKESRIKSHTTALYHWISNPKRSNDEKEWINFYKTHFKVDEGGRRTTRTRAS